MQASPEERSSSGDASAISIVEKAGRGHLEADELEGRGHRAIMAYHHRIMRTTIDIPEHLLIEAKQQAAERRLPLTRLLQRSRRAQTEPAPLPVLRDPVPVEGIDLEDTSRLWDLK